MTLYKFVYSDSALKDLSSLSLPIADRIDTKLNFYVNQENPLKYAKKLKNSETEAYRFRVGDYRAIFRIDKDGVIVVLVVLKIKHRREAY